MYENLFEEFKDIYNIELTGDEVIIMRNALRLAQERGFSDCSITSEELKTVEDKLMKQYNEQEDIIRNRIETKLKEVLKEYVMNNTEIEQEFFKVFEIKPKKIPTQPGWCPDVINDYPDISSEKLLQMVCILNKNELWGLPNNYNSAIQQILQSCVFFAECGCDCASVTKEEVQKFKQQIQQLFKEK